nr:DNA-directed RNA polymerase III subunit RPC7-like [Tanacetum cinerariifolium]
TLQAREQVIAMLKFYLKAAQERMVTYAEKKRSDREFAVGSFPLCDSEGSLAVIPYNILDRKFAKQGNRAVVYGLNHWSNGTVEDSTWELLTDIKKRFLEFDIDPRGHGSMEGGSNVIGENEFDIDPRGQGSMEGGSNVIGENAKTYGGKRRHPLLDFIKMSDEYVHVELLPKNVIAKLKNKKVRWDPKSNLKRLYLFGIMDRLTWGDQDGEDDEDEDEDKEIRDALEEEDDESDFGCS